VKFSLNWLRELCDVDAPANDVASKLTFAGFEVEGVHEQKKTLEHVIVVEVAEVSPHPQADKLKVVKVLDGEGTRTIVCGAPNVKVGSRVPLAEPGAILGGKEIKVAALRGVTSEGMLCSERELGFSDDHGGLAELPSDWSLGKRLIDTPLCDTLLEVSITPNRPDAMSHLGLAREMAAVFGSRTRKPRVLLREDGGDVGERVAVEIIEQGACKRYLSRVVTGLKVGPSSLAVRARLFSLGVRPINNVVDATNWVMLEVGHPLHAFDLGRLNSSGKQKRVLVRRAAKAETLTTLDGVTRQLKEDDLVIADSSRVLALAGIMGGEDSEIVDASSDVLVESAYFEPNVIYATSKRLGLHTEASNRFWRGTDIDGLSFANDRCCQLLSEWAGGKICRGVADVYPRRRQPAEVSLRPKRLNEYLGLQLGVEDVAKHLTSLDLTLKGRTDQGLTFGIPSFRVDLNTEVDLIEEVARLHGYALIPERLPEAGGAYVSLQDAAADHRRLRDMLASLGLSEAINYSFVGEKEELAFRPEGVESAVTLQNPMSETESVMRTSLLPGLLKNARHNGQYGVLDVRLFEIGRVFHPRSGSLEGLDSRDAKLPVEEDRLSVLLSGPAAPFGWGMPKRDVDFFDIKRTAMALLDAWQLAVRFENLQPAPRAFHPGAFVRIIDENSQVLGVLGQIHPRSLAPFGLEGSYFALDMSLSAFGREAPVIRYQTLPRFPGIRRDLAVIVSESVRSGDLVDHALAQAKTLAKSLESVQLFDVYQGKPIPKGQLSLALSFHFRDIERTLTDAEVQEQFDGLVQSLKQKFELQLREGA
jgi:phenylalanyl-tRNA synthetase beta chain